MKNCPDRYSPQNDCDHAGKADKEMRDMHYSFLNTDYINQVNNDWVTGGCMDDIKKNLGYRFVLKNGTYTAQLKSGEPLQISLELENVGYASPYKARPVHLILKNTNTQAITVKEFTTDIRKWFSGTIQLQQNFIVDAAAGEYELYLSLPDNHASINDRFEYSIRLANENVWDESTGYNNLNHTVVVK